jgi:hypothetical protein
VEVFRVEAGSPAGVVSLAVAFPVVAFPVVAFPVVAFPVVAFPVVALFLPGDSDELDRLVWSVVGS